MYISHKNNCVGVSRNVDAFVVVFDFILCQIRACFCRYEHHSEVQHSGCIPGVFECKTGQATEDCGEEHNDHPPLHIQRFKTATPTIIALRTPELLSIKAFAGEYSFIRIYSFIKS